MNTCQDRGIVVSHGADEARAESHPFLPCTKAASLIARTRATCARTMCIHVTTLTFHSAVSFGDDVAPWKRMQNDSDRRQVDRQAG